MSNELYHYGIPGMRWGRRKALPPVQGNVPRNRTANNTQNTQTDNTQKKRSKTKTAIKIGAAVAGAALAAYGAKKVHDVIRDNKKRTALRVSGEQLMARDKFLQEYYSNKRKQSGSINGKDIADKFHNAVSKGNAARTARVGADVTERFQKYINQSNAARAAKVNKAAVSNFYDAARQKGPRDVLIGFYERNGGYHTKKYRFG